MPASGGFPRHLDTIELFALGEQPRVDRRREIRAGKSIPGDGKREEAPRVETHRTTHKALWRSPIEARELGDDRVARRAVDDEVRRTKGYPTIGPSRKGRVHRRDGRMRIDEVQPICERPGFQVPTSRRVRVWRTRLPTPRPSRSSTVRFPTPSRTNTSPTAEPSAPAPNSTMLDCRSARVARPRVAISSGDQFSVATHVSDIPARSTSLRSRVQYPCSPGRYPGATCRPGQQDWQANG